LAQRTLAASAAPPAPTAAHCRITRVCEPAVGLRQRKKQRTRDDLVRAAHELFLGQGYNRTTVDEIAAAVDVSQRTFFRYFANKEEVALAVMADAEDHFLRCLRARPDTENPLEALRAAVRETWQDLGAGGPGSIPVTSALEIIRLIESTPVLLAAHLRRTAEQERQVAAVLAEREGVDPGQDLRPRLLAAVFGAVIRTAHATWGSAGQPRCDDPGGMIAVIERHMDQLGPALAGDWHA
jgi:AcrR family transcriptional regulator